MRMASKSDIEVELWFDDTGACGRKWGRWCAETWRDGVRITGHGPDKQSAITALARALASQSRPVSAARFTIVEVERCWKTDVSVRRAPQPRHVRDSGAWPMLSFVIAPTTA